MQNNNSNSQATTIIDNNIRAKFVLVIDETGANLGNMPTFKALQEARDRGLNLVQMSTGMTPTVKFMDYGKFKFEESKKIKAQLKKQREAAVDEKEICFHPKTAENDLRIKAKKAVEFLKDGDRVKIIIKCVGREPQHLDIVNNTLNTFLKYVPNGGVVQITSDYGKNFSYMLSYDDVGTISNPHMGSTFSSFLEEEGITEEVNELVKQKVEVINRKRNLKFK